MKKRKLQPRANAASSARLYYYENILKKIEQLFSQSGLWPISYQMGEAMGLSWGSIPQELIVEVNNLLEKLKSHDEETYKHCLRVSHLCRFLGEQIELSPYDCLVAQFAGLLHDIGKMDVPVEVINKPSKLDDKEYARMKTHAERSAELMVNLESSSFFKDVQMAVLHHHERIDGKGYPFGLVGEEIPYISRLILVVDTVDAMSQDRAYRKGLPMEIVYQELEKHAGTQFDEELAMAFIQAHMEHSDIKDNENVIKLPFLVNAA